MNDLAEKAEAFRVAMVESGALNSVSQDKYFPQLRALEAAIADAGQQAIIGPRVSDEMIEAACIAGYGIGTDKDSTLHKLMKRALSAALAATS